MPATTTATDRIAALQAEIHKLQQNAATELIEKKNALLQEVAALDAQIEELSGKKPEKKTRRDGLPLWAECPPLES